MTCRVNCTCKVCGRVHLHITKRVRKATPKPIDPRVAALVQGNAGDDWAQTMMLLPTLDGHGGAKAFAP